eukprot:5726777-Amphidinium_carterae.1
MGWSVVLLLFIFGKQVVKQGDYIMAVNDVTGNDVNMIGECKRSVNLKFSIVNKHAARNSASASHSSQIHSG